MDGIDSRKKLLEEINAIKEVMGGKEAQKER